jgi:hypothetical protein
MNRLHMLSIVTAALLATACSGTADSGADTSSDALVDHVHQGPADAPAHEGATAPGHGAHDLVCPPGLELLPPPPPPPAGAGGGPVGAAPHEGPISFPAIPLCCPAGAPPGDAPVGMPGVIALPSAPTAPSAPSAPSARPPLPPFPPGCVPAMPAPGGEAPPLPASKPGEKPQLD